MLYHHPDKTFNRTIIQRVKLLIIKLGDRRFFQEIINRKCGTIFLLMSLQSRERRL